MKKRPLIVLTGPTAVGKTELSLKLAQAVNGEIISADSMQIYKYMDIGTAKIMPDQQMGIKHYLINQRFPDEEFNVFQFKNMVLTSIEEIHSKGKIPILTGGTGFYIHAVLYDTEFDENDGISLIREDLEKKAEALGNRWLHKELQKVDPVSADAIHENNKKRVIRALEYFYQTGQPISAHNERELKKESPYSFVYFVLNGDRKILYERIDKRVDDMIEKGLIQEVSRLKDLGYTRNLVSMQGIGYKEVMAYLDGECTLSQAVHQIKQDTRHFAKRQLTWFRREKQVIWLDKGLFQEKEDRLLDEMLFWVKEKLDLPVSLGKE